MGRLIAGRTGSKVKFGAVRFGTAARLHFMSSLSQLPYMMVYASCLPSLASVSKLPTQAPRSLLYIMLNVYTVGASLDGKSCRSLNFAGRESHAM